MPAAESSTATKETVDDISFALPIKKDYTTIPIA